MQKLKLKLLATALALVLLLSACGHKPTNSVSQMQSYTALIPVLSYDSDFLNATADEIEKGACVNLNIIAVDYGQLRDSVRAAQCQKVNPKR